MRPEIAEGQAEALRLRRGFAQGRPVRRGDQQAVGLGKIEQYNAVVLSLPEYAQTLNTAQRFIMPAINPFSTTNRDLSDGEIDDRLMHYDIPTDLPLVVQLSRFDIWKDPQG